MYKLYNVKSWGSISVHLLLEEMQIPYTNIWMTYEQVVAPGFRAISPLGYIPALGLDDGRTLFESGAIVTFVMAAHPDKGMSPPLGSDVGGEFLSWLNFMSANLYPAINHFDASSPYAGDAAQNAHIEAKATERCDFLWSILNKRLEAEGPWLMGKSYSALDIYAFMLSLWGKPTESAVHKKFPAVAKLARAIRVRPRLKAALEAHGVMEIGGYGG
ncbi:MAG: glutathione S-transferase family protein [Aestuariivirga sp.]